VIADGTDDIVQIGITLQDIDPPIWRRVHSGTPSQYRRHYVTAVGRARTISRIRRLHRVHHAPNRPRLEGRHTGDAR